MACKRSGVQVPYPPFAEVSEKLEVPTEASESLAESVFSFNRSIIACRF